MSIDIIPINGKSKYINYEIFEKSIISSIGHRCSNAKIFLFNNFPVSVSIETNIDIIIVIAIEPTTGNFYSPKMNGGKRVYFHNQIIPIKFISNHKYDNINIEENQVIANNDLVDYSNEINSIRFGLINYLSEKCDFISEELFVQPLIFIENDIDFYTDNYIISKNFNFHSLNKYFEKNTANIFISYKQWKSKEGYDALIFDIEKITNQASIDSKIGYLTKKKVERIAKQLSNSKLIYEELNKNLVIVSGKAGTGKSSELLLLTMKCISNGQNTLYLTYNKLLIFDIARTVKSFVNENLNNDKIENERIGESSVLTLHSFFYRLSKSLGVLHVLNADRIDKLVLVLKERMRIVYDFMHHQIANQKRIDFDLLKTNIQNHSKFDIGVKEVGIDLVNFLQKRNAQSINDLNRISVDFYNHKLKILGNIEANKIFLADYYGVLENILLQIENPQRFYEKYNVENKHDLLDLAIGFNAKYTEDKNGEKIITEKGFIEFKNRKVGGHRRKRTLFIDEAQDCHRLEKEILISIYGSSNIVIASGGKEQLIRHVELCKWDVSQSKRLIVKQHNTRNKSYRLKKTIVDFCNFIASKYQINLELEPIDSEDEGELLIDYRNNHNEKEITEIFNHLKLKGEVNGCTLYESIMVLLESNSQRNNLGGPSELSTEIGIINEFGNIEDSPQLNRGTWSHLNILNGYDYDFWDGTKEDKSQLIVPSTNESRVIYYESCRGLESWSVLCFSIDKFFKQKRDDPDAEKYLIEDMFLNQNNEQRKSMYAATWIIMALTRVIDTLYIQVNDKNSEFGKIVDEYLKKGNKNVRELTVNSNNNFKKVDSLKNERKLSIVKVVPVKIDPEDLIEF